MIGIAVVIMSAAVFALVTAFMIMAMAMIIIVIAVVLLVTVAVIVLRERNCRRKRQGNNCDGSDSKPGFG